MPDPVDATAPAWRLILIFLLSFFGLCAATLLLPHDPYIRMQQLAPTIQFQAIWGYERLAFDKTPIDVAVLGNSRLQAAVAAPLLTRTLSQQLGRPVRVANLAMPQEGRNAQYVIAKHLFASHPEVKLVILSAIEQMPREGHPAFRNIADSVDVVAAPLLINRGYVDDLAYIPFRQMSLFVQTLFPGAFGVHRDFDKPSYRGSEYDTTQSFDTPTGNHVDRDSVIQAETLRPIAAKRIAEITPPILPPWAADYEFAVERTYVRRIVELARANRSAVAFLYLPIYSNEGAVRDADFYRARGTLIEARMLAADHRNYSDYGHVNRIGSDRLTTSLATYIADHNLIERRDGQAGAVTGNR